MIDADRIAQNRAKLMECWPAFRTAIATVLATLQADGYRPRIQEAWRSPGDEAEAVAQGHSHVLFGFHNCTGADGTPEALAADVLDDDHPLNPTREYLMALAVAVRAQGLETGIAWGLPLPIQARLEQAISAKVAWAGSIGWDPTHCQPVGISIQQAKSGQRPTLTANT